MSTIPCVEHRIFCNNLSNVVSLNYFINVPLICSFFSEETKKAEICLWLKDNYQEVKDHSILLDKLVETFEIDFRFTITEIKLVEEALLKTFPLCNITVTNAREYPLIVSLFFHLHLFHFILYIMQNFGFYD